MIRLATAMLLLAQSLAMGQSAPVLTRVEQSRVDWTVHFEVQILAWQPRARHNEDIQRTTVFQFQQAAAVFPLLDHTASHDARPDAVTSAFEVAGKVVDDEPEILDGRQAGTKLGVWRARDVRTRDIELKLDIPMSCYETRIDEARALEIPWPVDTEWNEEIKSALEPQQFVESDAQVVRDLVERWTNGNPKKARPYHLAKYLAGRVLEHMQPSGEATVVTSRGPRAGVTTSTFISGFDVNGAAHAAKTGKGTPNDMAALLVAVYRAAGIPARPVIGLDVEATRELERVQFRTWVEFYLFDEKADRGEWIPVDIVAQRAFSSRAPDLDRRWKYFGDHEDLDEICPIAYHYHPPTTVQSAGPPALWGWIVIPGNPRADQLIRVWAAHTVKRGGE